MFRYVITFFPNDPETLFLLNKIFPSSVIKGSEVHLGNYPVNIVLDALCKINKVRPYIIYHLSHYHVPTNRELAYFQIIQGKIIKRRAVRQY